MSQSDTKTMIEDLGRRFVSEVPALKQLKLAVKLDLQAKGDHQIYRVEFPGPVASKDLGTDAKVELLIMRHDFNDMAMPKHTLNHWIEAYEAGKIKASGDTGILKLIANVIERHNRRRGG